MRQKKIPTKEKRLNCLFFKSIKLSRLEPDEAKMMSSPITEEIKEDILKHKNNKYPGVNSLEYRKTFLNTNFTQSLQL